MSKMICTLEELKEFNESLVSRYEQGKLTDLEYSNGKLFISSQLDPDVFARMVEADTTNYVAIDLSTGNEVEYTFSNDYYHTRIKLKRALPDRPYVDFIEEKQIIDKKEQIVYCFPGNRRFYIKKI